MRILLCVGMVAAALLAATAQAVPPAPSGAPPNGDWTRYLLSPTATVVSSEPASQTRNPAGGLTGNSLLGAGVDFEDGRDVARVGALPGTMAGDTDGDGNQLTSAYPTLIWDRWSDPPDYYRRLGWQKDFTTVWLWKQLTGETAATMMLGWRTEWDGPPIVNCRGSVGGKSFKIETCTAAPYPAPSKAFGCYDLMAWGLRAAFGEGEVLDLPIEVWVIAQSGNTKGPWAPYNHMQMVQILVPQAVWSALRAPVAEPPKTD